MATFTNMATLSYNGNVTNSNIITGELQEVLSATKTAVGDQYMAGEDISYVISIVNTGATAFTGLTVTDDLGAYASGTTTVAPLTYEPDSVRYYINGVLQAAPAVDAAATLVFSGISVPAGGNAVLVYRARANQYAPLDAGSTITNSATVAGTGITAAVTAAETVEAVERPILTISKSLNPTTVTENSEVTYTFVIQNTGNTAADAADAVIMTDTFDPILGDLTATFNGAAWTAPANFTYDQNTGVFSTVAGQITVPAATYTQAADGTWAVNPGTSTLTVTGII